MTDLRKAAEMLMKALDDGWVERGDSVVIALRQALAQPEQSCCCGEPTALGVVHRKDNPCYVAQPEREWVGLTDDEMSELYNLKYADYLSDYIGIVDFILIAGVVEAKLKEKNT